MLAPHVLVAATAYGLADLCAFILTGAGYRVTAVRSGAEADAALRAALTAFAAAVVDNAMSDLSGPQVIAAERTRGSRLPFVLTSGSLNPSDLAALAPPVLLVRKPFCRAELVRAVADAISGPGGPHPAAPTV